MTFLLQLGWERSEWLSAAAGVCRVNTDICGYLGVYGENLYFTTHHLSIEAN